MINESKIYAQSNLDFDGLLEESAIKPVQRSIIELSDEQDQPDLIPG